MAKCESCGTDAIKLSWKPSDPRYLCEGCFGGARCERAHEWYFKGGAPTPSFAVADKKSHLGTWDSSGRID